MKRLLFVLLLSLVGTAAADVPPPPPEKKEPVKTAPAKTAPDETADKTAEAAEVKPAPKKSGCSLDGESTPSSAAFLIAGLLALGYVRSRVAR